MLWRRDGAELWLPICSHRQCPGIGRLSIASRSRSSTACSGPGQAAIAARTRSAVYWCWAVDDPASYCAWWLEREAEARRKNPNYERVVPEYDKERASER